MIEILALSNLLRGFLDQILDFFFLWYFSFVQMLITA